jgi:dihydroorotate dehydrogenase (fumarate)
MSPWLGSRREEGRGARGCREAPAEVRLPLLRIGVLAAQVRGALAAAAGVESADEAVKYLLVGAEVVMTTSALLRHGIGPMRTLLSDLTDWLDARGVAAIGDIRGKMSRKRLGEPPSFGRAAFCTAGQAAPKLPAR